MVLDTTMHGPQITCQQGRLQHLHYSHLQNAMIYVHTVNTNLIVSVIYNNHMNIPQGCVGQQLNQHS